MKSTDKIYIAGHRGMVGSAIVRILEAEGFTNLIYRTSSELNLTRQADVENFFATEKPDYVFLAAAKVGGIHANSTYPAQFIYENMMIESNIIHSAYENNVKKLLFLGSSCIFPKLAPQPLKEDYLLSGSLEDTNEAYAVAKIAGLKLCEFYKQQYGCNFISAMPCNLYGTGDNYHPENSHVIPALIRKFHEAKESNAKSVELWGTGTPLREFLHVDDMAKACLYLMENYDGLQFVNVGYGEDLPISELAKIVQETVGFQGKTIYNTNMPDGTPKKLLDCSKLFNLGFKPEISLRDGLKLVYDDYLIFSESYRK